MTPGNGDGLGDLSDLRDLEEALAQALHADAERITRRMTLALRVFGRSETKRMAFGASGLPISAMTISVNS